MTKVAVDTEGMVQEFLAWASTVSDCGLVIRYEDASWELLLAGNYASAAEVTLALWACLDRRGLPVGVIGIARDAAGAPTGYLAEVRGSR